MCVSRHTKRALVRPEPPGTCTARSSRGFPDASVLPTAETLLSVASNPCRYRESESLRNTTILAHHERIPRVPSQLEGAHLQPRLTWSATFASARSLARVNFRCRRRESPGTVNVCEGIEYKIWKHSFAGFGDGKQRRASRVPTRDSISHNTIQHPEYPCMAGLLFFHKGFCDLRPRVLLWEHFYHVSGRACPEVRDFGRNL